MASSSSSSSFRVPPMSKLNRVPTEGVHIPVLFTMFKSTVNEKNPSKSPPTKVFGIPLVSREVVYRPRKNESVDYSDPATKTVVEAFSRNHMFKMFNCRTDALVHGGFYMFRGVTLSRYTNDEGRVIYSNEIAQIVEVGRMDLRSMLRQLPFSAYSIRTPDDFFDPEQIDPNVDAGASTSDETDPAGNGGEWEGNHALALELVASSTLPNSVEEAWFPGQSNTTLCARLPDTESMTFTYAADPMAPNKVQDIISGTSGSKLYLWANQRDENGKDTKICIKTRIYSESIRFLQCQDWATMGPLLSPHLCGLLVGTLNRQGLMKDFLFDTTMFSGTVFAYLQLIADLQQTLHHASNPTGPHQCAWKLSASAAQRILNEYLKQHKPTLPQLPMAMLKWVNAANLCMFNRPGLFDDAKFDYYIVSNYSFVNFREIRPLDKMTEDELVAEFLDVKRYPRKVIIDIYVSVKPGCKLGIEAVSKANASVDGDGADVVALNHHKRVLPLPEPAAADDAASKAASLLTVQQQQPSKKAKEQQQQQQ